MSACPEQLATHQHSSACHRASEDSSWQFPSRIPLQAAVAPRQELVPAGKHSGSGAASPLQFVRLYGHHWELRRLILAQQFHSPSSSEPGTIASCEKQRFWGQCCCPVLSEQKAACSSMAALMLPSCTRCSGAGIALLPIQWQIQRDIQLTPGELGSLCQFCARQSDTSPNPCLTSQQKSL